MGENFLLSCLEVPNVFAADYVPQVREAGRRLRERVLSPDFDVVKALENSQSVLLYDEQEPNEIKNSIAAAITRIEEALLLETSRQIAMFYLNGRHYAFVGGMSWGDPASDYSDDFDLLFDLDLEFYDTSRRCAPKKPCPERLAAQSAPNDVKDAAFAAGISSNWRFCPWCGEQEK